jgi:uncharacterized NAD(P)/FAD-binding protein YdhS
MRLAIIGIGPTALYTLKALIDEAPPSHIVLFEAGVRAGPGTPFSDLHNSCDALANIAGVELPPLRETLNQWASRQSARRLEAWGIAGEADNDRAFFPRVALGAYFADQLRLMLARPGRHVITLRQRARVTDVMARADGTVLRWHSHGQDHEEVFDRLVIATGYSTPRRKVDVPGASEIRQANKVGVLGSSLSAIDVAVDLARRNGRFQSDGAKLRYAADRNWHVTLLSRSGLLPEADFWFPHPPEPLDLFTDAALARIVSGKDGDLDRAFDLFARQLRALDPAYGEVIGLDQADADSFADRHFARRMASDPFAWAVRDLADACRSHRTKHAQPWRYALLRMHEPFGRIVPLLSKRDLGRFERGLKRCFTDNYAAVPHLSIRRLLAMHEAGVLAVKRLGDSYELTREEQGWRIRSAGRDLRFDAVADARGQQALGLPDFPFPTLRLQLCAHALAHHRDSDEGLPPNSGVNGYSLDAYDPVLSRIHCLALPFLLKRHPFIQGLVESAAMARASVAVMLEPADHRVPRDDLETMIARLGDDTIVYCGSSGVFTIPRTPSVNGEAAVQS